MRKSPFEPLSVQIADRRSRKQGLSLIDYDNDDDDDDDDDDDGDGEDDDDYEDDDYEDENDGDGDQHKKRDESESEGEDERRRMMKGGGRERREGPYKYTGESVEKRKRKRRRKRANFATLQNFSNASKETLESKWIYFENLALNAVSINFSFANVSSMVDRDDNSQISRLLSRGGALANIDSAPIFLTPMVLEHPFTSDSDLLDRISKHYSEVIMAGIFNVLVGADVFGSPISLGRAFRTGFQDFVSEPAKGIANRDCKEASFGFLRGLNSLLKHSIYGVFNSLGKFSNTVGKGAAELTFDRQYVQEREIMGREKPRHLGEGIAFGLRDLGLGLFQGISSLAIDPIQGALEDGVPGLFTGLARGVAGAGLKPAIGIFDMTTRLSEGIRNTTTYWEQKERGRIRPPRFFGRDHVLESYDPVKAEGQELLYVLDDGKYADNFYVYHFVEENSITLVSDAHIISINRYNRKEEWHINIHDIRLARRDSGGIVFVLRRFCSSNPFEAPTNVRILFISDDETRLRIFLQLRDILESLKPDLQ